jgi:hypothetical protein
MYTVHPTGHCYTQYCIQFNHIYSSCLILPVSVTAHQIQLMHANRNLPLNQTNVARRFCRKQHKLAAFRLPEHELRRLYLMQHALSALACMPRPPPPASRHLATVALDLPRNYVLDPIRLIASIQRTLVSSKSRNRSFLTYLVLRSYVAWTANS